MLFEAVHHFWDLVACEGMDLVEVVKALVEVRRMRLVEKSHLPAQHAGKEELLRKKLWPQLQTRGRSTWRCQVGVLSYLGVLTNEVPNVVIEAFMPVRS